MQTTKPKFGLTTYLNVCPGPWKNSEQDSTVDQTNLVVKRTKPKHESPSPVLNLTNKSNSHAPIPFNIAVPYHIPATLSGTGSRGNFEKLWETEFLPGNKNSEPEM